MLPAELPHRVIEQAKASFRADGCDMTFEQCLAFHAESMVRLPLCWHLCERNGVWALEIWEPD